MPYEFEQVDVFTDRPLFGNPAAVVFGAEELQTVTLQKIAREMNLSETVFILPPSTTEADYRARIFTPMNEMRFAGHPTIAAAYSVHARHPEKAKGSLLRQECGIGIVPVEIVRSSNDVLFHMTQAHAEYRDSGLSKEHIARMLGCTVEDLAASPVEVVSTGVNWLIVELARADAISELRPDQSLIEAECKKLRTAGVTVFVERGTSSSARIRVRTFAPGEGVAEDPVCGSGNGSVAAFVARYKDASEAQGSYVAEQGIEIGRDGIVHASWSRHDGVVRVRIGGQATLSARGQLLI